MRRRRPTFMALAAAAVISSPSCHLVDALQFVITPRLSSSSSSCTITTMMRRQRSRPSSPPFSASSSRGNNNDTMQRRSSMEDGDNNNLLLDVAFSNLNDVDKYETVLAGLCAKIIDDGTENYAKSTISDIIQLVEEMNARGVSAGPRGIISLIDATALLSDASIMANVLSLAKRNGAIRKYGILQSDIDPIPRVQQRNQQQRQSSPTPFSFGRGSSGSDKERKMKRLITLPPIPDDDRATEVTQAAIFGIMIASCIGINIFDGVFHTVDAITPWTNLVLGSAVSIVIIDNSFDVLVGTTQTLSRLNESKLPNAISNCIKSIPNKENMPLGIGTGQVSGSIVRGISRLLSNDTERDCMCEAAAVYVAYGLGLPCFAFRPNENEGASLVLQSMNMGQEEYNTDGRNNGYDSSRAARIDSLVSDVGLLKVMIWLLAPVAIELSRYPQLLSSEPRVASAFLKQLRDKSASSGYSMLTLSDALPIDDDEIDTYLRWALAEADVLLRRNVRAVDSLSEALAGGAATVGDCVAILEGW